MATKKEVGVGSRVRVVSTIGSEDRKGFVTEMLNSKRGAWAHVNLGTKTDPLMRKFRVGNLKMY